MVTIIIPDPYHQPFKRPKTTQIQARICKYLEALEQKSYLSTLQTPNPQYEKEASILKNLNLSNHQEAGDDKNNLFLE